MENKILFIDNRHVLSRIAEHYAKKYVAEKKSISSAGVSNYTITDAEKEIFDKLGIPAIDRVSFLSNKADHFDLVITIGSLPDNNSPVFQGFPPVIHWNIEIPNSFNLQEWEQIAHEIEMLVLHLFNHGFLKTLIRQKNQLGNVLDSLQEGILAHDMNRKIFLFSRGAEAITGASREQIIGKDCHDVFKPHVCGEKCIFLDKSNVKDIKKSSFPVLFTAGSGGRKEIDITRFPLEDEDGKIIGAVAVFSDSTRLKELEIRLGETESFAGIIGQDHEMQILFQMIRDLAASDFPVVITGESGTGKELVAAAIHKESDRRDQAFVAVNCGALPEGTLESELFGHVRGAFTGAIKDKKGRFELADKGTLFLDEIAELTPKMQVKLLRVLQEGVVEPVGSEVPKMVDVRIVCATNRNLKEMVSRGEFREDLYYRLAVVPIELPPLRKRRNDIVLLSRHFLERIAKKLSRSEMSFAEDSISILMNYEWPGNVRQLQNVIQYAMIKCRGKQINPEHLPPEITGKSYLPSFSVISTKAGRKPKLTSDIVESALVKAGGNKAKAARILRVGRATLYNFINNHSEIIPAESE